VLRASDSGSRFCNWLSKEIKKNRNRNDDLQNSLSQTWPVCVQKTQIETTHDMHIFTHRECSKSSCALLKLIKAEIAEGTRIIGVSTEKINQKPG
jgi:hypothetical protein